MTEQFKTFVISNMNTVDGCLILTLPQLINEEFLNAIRKDLLDKISNRDSRGVVIDFGSLNLIDSFEFNEMKNTIEMLRIMGFEVACVNLQPGLVLTAIELNLDVENLNTFLTLEDGIHFLKELNFQNEEEDVIENEVDELDDKIETDMEIN